MADDKRRLIIEDLSGGRNGYLAPLSIDNDECSEAINVDWYRTMFAHKRGGTAAISLTFSAGGPFTTAIGFMFRHVPGSNEQAAELWAFDATMWGRLAGAATWTAPTFKDAWTGTFAQDVSAATINGHLMLAYKSAVNRLHVWDTATIRRSEPGAGVAFTPSGLFTAAVVTQGTPPNEGETHWEVEASLDNVTFYRIATVVVGTTTYSDTAVTSTYNTNPLSAATGTYTVQKSYKFVATDQNRTLGFGSNTSTDKQSRVEYSAVIGSLDVGDEERVDTTSNYYLDLDESDSGDAVGLAGPVNGAFFAFKFKQIAQLTPTGNTAQPYSMRFLSKTIGALTDHCIVKGEDEFGNPCLYWMSHRGPYRWGQNGLQYIGRNIEDCILGPTSTLWVSSSDRRLAHTVYYQDKRQVWFWIATNTSGPNNFSLLIYHIMTDGWSRFTGSPATNMVASVMFSATIGASMSNDLKPYGSTSSNVAASGEILKWDTGTTDTAGAVVTNIQAYVIPKVLEPGGAGYYGEVGTAIVSAAAGAGMSVTATVIGDYGMTGKSATGTANLTPRTVETQVTVPLQDSALSGDVLSVQYQVGDASPNALTWTLNRLVIPVVRKGSVTG